MQKTELYKNKKELSEESARLSKASDSKTSTREKKQREKDMTSPGRKKRQRAMRAAKDIERARQRQMVVGQPSWPLDWSGDGPHHQNA
jgi:hypothetical protein